MTEIKDNELLSFDEAFEKVKDTIKAALDSSPLIIREYTKHLTASQGKFIRAQSLLACAQNENDKIQREAVTFAASIEIIHLASLVHDDIIDDAETRRGVITLQKKYGRRTAVICGDFLLCTALKIAANVKNRRDYDGLSMPDYMSRLCLGELYQHINNGNLDLSFKTYLKIISGKTAALFEASFYAGAVLCEKDEKILRLYRRLGHHIGMIFQLTDDCIDFEVSEQIAKKPVQSDYEQGTITLPLIYTLKNSDGFKKKLSSEHITRDEFNNTIIKAGGLKFTHLISKRYYDKALKIIDRLILTDDKKAKLMLVLDKSYFGLKLITK